MAERSWFFASNGQQQGPVPESQFRELIARSAITPDTLVWTDGMANWQRAADVPGLINGARPPAMPQDGPPPVMAGAGYAASGAISIDFGIWEFVWRGFVTALGCAFVVPGPWLIVWFLKWIVPHIGVPARPNLSFTGNAMTVVPWYFGAVVLVAAATYYSISNEVQWPNQLIDIVEFVLYWLFIRWIVANLASNGQPLGLSFSGSVWGYLGWVILLLISFITIVGWAWVFAAAARWICRHIEGTRRQLVYKGTGLENLLRGIVFVVGCVFIIPIPWVYRWMMRWQFSQTVLVERT